MKECGALSLQNEVPTPQDGSERVLCQLSNQSLACPMITRRAVTRNGKPSEDASLYFSRL